MSEHDRMLKDELVRQLQEHAEITNLSDVIARLIQEDRSKHALYDHDYCLDCKLGGFETTAGMIGKEMLLWEFNPHTGHGIHLCVFCRAKRQHPEYEVEIDSMRLRHIFEGRI